MTTQDPSPSLPSPSPGHEQARARLRRERLGVQRPPGHEAVQWALALSGGGIRSATVCLGVLQAMARSPSPPQAQPSQPLLTQFDYLSTVSGGGYIGGFFNSLFVRGRLSGQADEDDATAAHRAYAAMRDEPPARIHADTVYDPAHPGRAALAWLRDNGRYLAPTGAGDLLYGTGITLRNWLATHYVVGTLILMILAAILSARLGLALLLPELALIESHLHARALASTALVWWSPTWWLCAAVLLLGTGAIGLAYWFSHPPRGAKPLTAPPEAFSLASLMGAVIALALGGLGWLVGWDEATPRAPLGRAISAGGAFVALGVGWYLLSAWRARAQTVTLQRVLLSRWNARSLQVLIILGLAASIETLAQTAWLWLAAPSALLASSLIVLAVWVLRVLAPKLGDRSMRLLLQKVPLDVMAGVVGVALWLITASALYVLLLALVWFGVDRGPQAWLHEPTLQSLLTYALGSLATVTGLALVVGHFPGFLNLSTFQSLYSARLIRAYLGATNHRRFTEADQSRRRDVAEPIQDDSLDGQAPYANPCGPTHFINVCINQTVSPGEQLVQRDRKGTPLVIAPHGFYAHGSGHRMNEGAGTELNHPLSYGEWIGVSGAAFSTGLGRGTGLGFSLVLGFANIRLGRWWPGASQPDQKQGGLVRRLFTTQVYLTDEIRGVFFGRHRPYQYLSDGGHFENTAVYELINPARDRQVRLIVLCDNGCDADYAFADLANLVRLARIDHGLEIRVNPEAHLDPQLMAVFGTPQDIGRAPASTRCAVLLDVLSTARQADAGGPPAGTVVARIVLLKPTMMADVPVDLAHYQSAHPAFPQQSTADQFFDEAQWESYRQLGLHMGRRVFPQDADSGYAQAFWRVCLGGLGHAPAAA